MDSVYNFVQTVNTQQLNDEILTAGLTLPDYITTDGTAVGIYYVSDLNSVDQTTLSNVVANHIVNPNYVPLALQAQINTLTGYLNSTAPAVVSAARVAILAALGPHLPLATLCAINAAVHSQTGA